MTATVQMFNFWNDINRIWSCNLILNRVSQFSLGKFRRYDWPVSSHFNSIIDNNLAFGNLETRLPSELTRVRPRNGHDAYVVMLHNQSSLETSLKALNSLRFYFQIKFLVASLFLRQFCPYETIHQVILSLCIESRWDLSLRHHIVFIYVIVSDHLRNRTK